MTPLWLHELSIASLSLASLCSLVIAIDEIKRPQSMPIMNAVWPITALFGGLLWSWGYLRFGRADERSSNRSAAKSQPKGRKPFAISVAEATSHCGSGCALGDLCAEWLAFTVPVIATVFGWHWMFQEKMFAVWVLDFIFAFLFGIVFQYFTIAPMRGLTLISGLKAAIKADALSLSAWQVGMYGFMAVADLWVFRDIFGVELKVDSPEFWFVMQIAMLCGFAVSYPVNWWLLRTGVKEKM